jgi:F420-0:gamma-glutamyl ligase
MSRLTIWGIEGIGEITPQDQLGKIISDACRQEPNGPLQNNDVLVVTQKIVSKAEEMPERLNKQNLFDII